MRKARPLLRLAGLALPLLAAAGCSSDRVVTAPAGPDTSCLLLCALTQEIWGPTPAEPAPAPVPAAKAGTAIRAGQRHAAAAPARQRPVVRHHQRHRVSGLSTVRPQAHAPQVSVVPQSPTGAAAPASVAIVPPAPAPVAVAPAEPAQAAPPRTLSQSIPGSVGIVAPTWQDR